jgi:hypothetical protein
VLESLVRFRTRLEHGDARGTDPDDDVHGAPEEGMTPRRGGGA